MKRAALAAALVAGFVPLPMTSGASAQGFEGYSCAELWYQRNSIYKAAGYCFKTPRAIRAFGNAGCQYDSEYELPLSPRQRATVNAIVRAERYQGCPR